MGISYQVYCGSRWTGPLDQLLEAARSKDVPLAELELSELIEDFRCHLEDQVRWSVSETSEYLLLFSELIRIKTRLLVPSPEREETEDEREDLEEVSFYQKVAGELRDRYNQRARLYDTRPDLPDAVETGETNYQEVTLFELIQAFKKIQSTNQDPELPELEITNEYDTHERMEFILSACESRDQLPFTRLISKQPTREELIVTFLAILQLVKQEDLRLVREPDSDMIYILENGG